MIKQVFRLAVVLASAVFAHAAQAQDFPVTITHAFGETTIPAKPQRIVTWGWGAQDAVIALGEVPVGVPFFSYGADAEGVLAWTREGVEALGAAYPTILPNAAEPPVEAIAALTPDLIVAVYSGLTEDEYNVLSGIAPVVAYPEGPWATTWQETITITGEAMGKKAEAEALVADLTTFIGEETAKYPEVAGISFAGIMDYNGQVAVYAPLDARTKFLVDAGLSTPQSVIDRAEGSEFYFSVSYENFDQIGADIIISYFDTPEADAAFFDNPVIALAPPVEKGAVAHVIGPDLISSMSPPSALSLKWGYPRYIELIAGAAEAARR